MIILGTDRLTEVELTSFEKFITSLPSKSINEEVLDAYCRNRNFKILFYENYAEKILTIVK